MIKFFIALIILTAVIMTSGLVATAYQYWTQPSFFFPTLILLASATGILYVYLDKAASGLFVQLYLLTIAVKILAFGAYIIVVVLDDKACALENVVFFMISYFAFTALEIGFLYRKKTR